MTDETASPDEGTSSALQQAAVWRMRLETQEHTPGMMAAFEAWLAEDELHRRAFERSGNVWNLLDQHSASAELMVIRRDALDRAQRTVRDRLSRQSGWMVRAPRRRTIAASIAALVMLAAGSSVLMQRGDFYQTGRNERRLVNLDDGSRISLDAMSQVRVKFSRNARRLELIKGQARFDVAHDAARPFSVRAKDRTVVATGTAFNIDIFEKTARVTLIEGRVLITPVKPARVLGQAIGPTPEVELKPIVLRAGQQLVVPQDAPPRVLAAVDVQRTVAWQQGKLMFDKDPLAEVVARMNRYSDRKMLIGDAIAGAVPVSGSFDAGNTRGFLEAVTSYLPVTATDGPNGVVLNAAEPND